MDRPPQSQQQYDHQATAGTSRTFDTDREKVEHNTNRQIPAAIAAHAESQHARQQQDHQRKHCRSKQRNFAGPSRGAHRGRGRGGSRCRSGRADRAGHQSDLRGRGQPGAYKSRTAEQVVQDLRQAYAADNVPVPQGLDLQKLVEAFLGCATVESADKL